MAIDQRSETDLQAAIARRNLDQARDLLEAGADVDQVGRLDWTALHWAGYMGSAEGIRLLLDHGARIDPRDVAGNTPLLCALVAADWFKTPKRTPAAPAAVALLLAEGADPAAANRAGTTPQSFAHTPGLDPALAGQFEPGGGPPPRVVVAHSTPNQIELEITDEGGVKRRLTVHGDNLMMENGTTDRVLRSGGLDFWDGDWSGGASGPNAPKAVDADLREFLRCCLIATGNLFD